MIEKEAEQLREVGPGEEPPIAPVSAETISDRVLKITRGIIEMETLFPTIRLNQLKGLKKLLAFLEAGKTKGYFRMPTGAGKTILFGLIIKLLQENTLYLVPNTNLLNSSYEELVDVLKIPPEDVGVVGGGKKEEGRKITLMTYQSFLTHGVPQGVTLRILDEVHRSLGDRTREEINRALGVEWGEEAEITEAEEAAEIEALERLSLMRGFLDVGGTATDVLGQKLVEAIHGELIDSTTYAELVEAGVLKRVRVHPVKTKLEQSEEHGRLTQEKEDRILKTAQAYGKVLDEFVSFSAAFKDYPLRTVAFCHSISGCRTFAEQATARGLKVRVVTGEEGDLKQAEKDLLSGEIQIIITVDKLKEGWNFPPVNTVLWLRATSSPASLIQGVGRGMRAYLNEAHMHLFEADWELYSSDSNQGERSDGERSDSASGELGRSKKILNFAQALAHMGEDVSKIIENADETSFYIYLDLNEKGVALHPEQGELCGISAYAGFLKVAPSTLAGMVVRNDLEAIPGTLGRSGSQCVPLFLKSQVDAAFEREYKLSLPEAGFIHIPSYGAELCGLSRYAKAKNVKPDTMERWVEEAGFEPVPGYIAHSGKRMVELYDRAKIDQLIAAKRILIKKEGILELPGKGEGVAVGTYCETVKIRRGDLRTWVIEAGLTPIGKGRMNLTSAEVDLYSRQEVDDLIYKNRGYPLVGGVATLRDGTQLCALQAYAEAHPDSFKPATLAAWLEKASVVPVPDLKGLSYRTQVDLYSKNEVDAVIAQNSGVRLNTEGWAITSDYGEVCGLSGIGRNLGIGDARTIKRWLDAAGVLPIPDISIHGSTKAELYPRAKVLEVIYQNRPDLKD